MPDSQHHHAWAGYPWRLGQVSGAGAALSSMDASNEVPTSMCPIHIFVVVVASRAGSCLSSQS
eukprot:352277-Chlamydomonas_euryale.AAC.6